VRVTLNGKERDIEKDGSVGSLIALIGARAEQVAVAVNGVVVRRVDWEGTAIRDGDVVEVVRAVGGGRE
jgi:sulfur carrier protein